MGPSFQVSSSLPRWSHEDRSVSFLHAWTPRAQAEGGTPCSKGSRIGWSHVCKSYRPRGDCDEGRSLCLEVPANRRHKGHTGSHRGTGLARRQRKRGERMGGRLVVVSQDRRRRGRISRSKIAGWNDFMVCGHRGCLESSVHGPGVTGVGHSGPKLKSKAQ